MAAIRGGSNKESLFVEGWQGYPGAPSPKPRQPAGATEAGKVELLWAVLISWLDQSRVSLDEETFFAASSHCRWLRAREAHKRLVIAPERACRLPQPWKRETLLSAGRCKTRTLLLRTARYQR